MGRNEYTYKKGYRGTPGERMENKTIKGGPDDCWLWSGSCDTPGYATIRIDGKLRRASHVAFELNTGKQIPAGMVIMHSCDTPACVNPNHLFLGTKLLNSLDKKNKGRCNSPKGEKHPMRKLTEKEVDEIRNIYSQGNHTYTELAPRFNVNRTTISKIVNGKNWRQNSS